jgi:Flp pilus assembly protein TadD
MLKYFNPLLWLRWTSQFFYAWSLAIPWRDAPKAIPALILVVVLGVAGVIAWSDTSNWRSQLLNNQLQVALDQENYATAELVLLRQLRRRPDDTQLLHRLALVLDAKGESERAAELMREMSKVKLDTDASRWLLNREFLGKDWASLSEEQREEFGRLLKILHEEKRDDLAIQQLYAEYLIAAEKYPQAIPVLTALIPAQPMRGLQAAAISRKLGNHAAADRLAERTLEKVSQLSEEDPTNTSLALAVAQNQLFLKRFPEAVQTLELAAQRAKALKADEDYEKLKQAVGDSIVAWVNSLQEPAAGGINDRLRILRMLQSALEYAPNNPRVLTLVADQVLAAMNEEDAQVVAVREALINGSSAGIAHFIRGTAALLRDDLDSATTSLKLAAEHMPHSGAILNNLAVALAAREPADLESALKISDSAIKQSASPTPYFYETRGQILFRLGRYLDAIPDLERALPIPALALGAHNSLAICYEQIGDQELSRMHREKAQAFAAPPASAEPAVSQ